MLQGAVKGTDLNGRTETQTQRFWRRKPQAATGSSHSSAGRINRSPQFGVGRRGSPICSDFYVSFRFVAICAPCLRECPELFRFAPVSFRFVPICFQNKSEQIWETLSADPSCKSPNPSRDAMFFEPQKSHQNNARNCYKHDVLEPGKQASFRIT